MNTKGKTLVCNNIIDDRYECFLGECKNYDKKVSVTYVGKFCSLMLTNQIKLGIMFSYHGISGKNWNAGQGLIKKFYLHKENLKERYCIIDFNKEDFKSILNGDNFLNIVEKKMECLQFDTDYTRYLNDNGSK